MTFAVTWPDAILALTVSLITAIPATAALYVSLRTDRKARHIEQQTTVMAPKVVAIDAAVNQKDTPESPTLRETAEATHDLAEGLRDQEDARVVERTEDRAEKDDDR